MRTDLPLRITERTVGRILSLGTLLIGVLLGFLLGILYRPGSIVNAQAVQAVNPTVKEVSPNLVVGSAGTNLLLAHEIAADSVIVNGLDLLKFDQLLLDYLAARPGAENADFQNIANASRATVAYKIKVNAPPSPPATAPLPEGKK